jgi:outer membrane lipoprotein SlyB
MRKFMLALGAMSLVVPTVVTFSTVDASAQSRHYKKHNKRYAYREWRGRDGRQYCRKSNGTTGLIVGAAGGALLGRAIDTHGERGTGTILGAVGGALAGREIARNRSTRHCR